MRSREKLGARLLRCVPPVSRTDIARCRDPGCVRPSRVARPFRQSDHARMVRTLLLR